jgi:hypothetical protein
MAPTTNSVYDGTASLRITIGGTEELATWVMRMARWVEVLTESLRERVRGCGSRRSTFAWHVIVCPKFGFGQPIALIFSPSFGTLA